MKWRAFVLAVILAGAGAKLALACTGYLTHQAVIETTRNGYTRRVRMCFYDHLGEPHIVTVPSHAFCAATINVAHDNEDRDGDGVEDDEEGRDE
jgi:hypothetical protein